VTAILLFLSTWKWWLIGGLVAASAVTIGYLKIDNAQLEAKVSEWKAKWSKSEADRADDRTRAAQAALKTAAEYREKEQGWNRKFEEDRNANETKQAALEAAKRRADAVVGSLSNRVAALTAAARRPTPGASAPAACEAAGEAADLLSRMYGRVDAAATAIATYADKLRISGELCVSSYEVVTKPTAAAAAASDPS
jgi:ATPase subunit of ABC transporter with duplicated ATPase domains